MVYSLRLSALSLLSILIAPTQVTADGLNMDCSKLPEVQKLAEQGDTEAEREMSQVYASGHCLVQDLQKSSFYLVQSATGGNVEAQTSLGILFYKDDHYSEAAEWLGKAADKRDARAEAFLGLLYEKGKGVSQNDTEAVKWYRKAAEQNNFLGQTSLAKMYINGKGGLPQDYIEADKWYILSDSAKYSDGSGQDVRRVLELQMHKKDSNESQKRAREWKSKKSFIQE